MGNDVLTTAKALKFARHDFLNELQLILLYIDLGKLPEAKKKILDTTEGMRQAAMLDKLGLPETEIWLTSFNWNYSAFPKKMTCDIITGNRKADDVAVAAYLKQVFNEAEDAVDAEYEYETQIDVHATANDWSITITVNGVMNNMRPAPKTDGNGTFKVEESISENQWTFTISGQ